MIKILFVCHGNICRSPMAEFIMKDLVEKKKLSHLFHIESCACHDDALGCRPHRGTREKLREVGISTEGKVARLVTYDDYEKFDYIIAMDRYNVYDLEYKFRGDPAGKVRLLLDYAGIKRDVADPWYTGNFEDTYSDCLTGCNALLKYILSKN